MSSAASPQDWTELHRLVTRYSMGLDSRDYDMVRSVWAPEPLASYDMSTAGVERDMLTYHSADELISDVSRMHGALSALMHRNTNHHFDVDADRATGRVYVDLFQVRTDGDDYKTVHHVGWYDDIYERHDGHWKIKERHFPSSGPKPSQSRSGSASGRPPSSPRAEWWF